MRGIAFGSMTAMAACLATTAASAADKPLYQPAPAWVKPVALPTEPKSPAAKGDDEVPVKILLSDQQVDFQPGLVTVYSDVALKIGTPQGLAAGNISLPWKPDSDTLIVHRVVIRRGDKIIDVLAGGQTFTVVRRETNLENATLDGVLTANIQPEGLQIGDVLEFAISIVSRDPVMQRNVEFAGAAWNALPISRAHLHVRWPSTMPVRFDAIQGLPAIKAVKAVDGTMIDVALDNIVPLVLPKGAPVRYRIGRMIELSSFASWADVAALLAPLYAQTAVLPAQGPLLAEVDRIRAASADPKTRAEAALALVQDRIRYVALAMGTGGLVPADTGTTWSRRFGDCKGKTVLLVAILRSLGIDADAVAVSSGLGDGMDMRLPRVGAFDHVLVRATIAGKTYWLDGTRTGDVSLDRLTVPAFGWGLPLVAKGATLVRMMPAPLAQPMTDVSIRIDATKGLMVPAPIRIESVMRGDAAVGLGMALANVTGAARDRALRDYWKGQYDFIDVTSAATSFDEKTGERRLSMEGKARMDWSSGWYEADGMGIGYRADFARDPGPDRDAPFAVAYPYYARTVETILLPPGFPEQKAEGKNDIDRTVAGIQYRRRVTLAGGVFTAERTERTLVPEFPAKDAPAAQVALRDLADQTLYIRRPSTYQVSEEELKVWQAKTLTSDSAYIERGYALMNRRRYDEAIKDFDAALVIDPKNVDALACRGFVNVLTLDYKAAHQDFDAAEKLDPRSLNLWKGRAKEAEQTDDLKAARLAYTRALETAPGDIALLRARAQIEQRMNDKEAALADLAVVLAREPTSVYTYLLRANILRSMGKSEAVAGEVDALLKANPTNGYAHVVAAQIYAALNRPKDAMLQFDKALAIRPLAYVYLARMNARPFDDHVGRMADATAALKLEPDLPEALTAKATMLVADGKFADAIPIYDAQLAKSPTNVDLLAARGIARLRAGDTKRGEADLVAASAQAKIDYQLNDLCWSKATAGIALQSALADCDRAVALSPKVAAFLDSRGFVLLRLERNDEAIAAYTQALAIQPDKAASLFGRGIAWKRKGDAARAAADFAAADKSEPRMREAFVVYGVTS